MHSLHKSVENIIPEKKPIASKNKEIAEKMLNIAAISD